MHGEYDKTCDICVLRKISTVLRENIILASVGFSLHHRKHLVPKMAT